MSSDPKVIHDYDREDVPMGESPSAGHSAFKQGAYGCEYADEISYNPPRRNHPGFKDMQKRMAKVGKMPKLPKMKKSAY